MTSLSFQKQERRDELMLKRLIYFIKYATWRIKLWQLLRKIAS